MYLDNMSLVTTSQRCFLLNRIGCPTRASLQWYPPLQSHTYQLFLGPYVLCSLHQRSTSVQGLSILEFPWSPPDISVAPLLCQLLALENTMNLAVVPPFVHFSGKNLCNNVHGLSLCSAFCHTFSCWRRSAGQLLLVTIICSRRDFFTQWVDSVQDSFAEQNQASRETRPWMYTAMSP